MSRYWPALLLLGASCGPDAVSSSGETGSEPIFDPAVDCVDIVDVQTAWGTHFWTCVLASNGATRCWGNIHGEVIGDDEPAFMAGWLDLRLTTLSVGMDVSGATASGVLGSLDAFPWLGPMEEVQVVDGYDFGADVVDVSVSDSGACALLEDGAVRCWGSRLTSGVMEDVGAYVGDDEPPSVVELPAKALQVSVGAYSACAVLETGDLACWGKDPCDPACGVLGVPGAEPYTPHLVELPEPALEVSVGVASACARLEGGTITCWGEARRLGRGEDAENIGDDETPASVPVIDFGQPVQAIDGATCVLLADGTVRCWWNPRTSTPLDPDGEPVLDALQAPTIPLPEPVTTISVSYHLYACSLGESGAVYCWGAPGNGVQGYGHEDEIGLDPNVTVVQPVPVLDPRCDED